MSTAAAVTSIAVEAAVAISTTEAAVVVAVVAPIKAAAAAALLPLLPELLTLMLGLVRRLATGPLHSHGGVACDTTDIVLLDLLPAALAKSDHLLQTEAEAQVDVLVLAERHDLLEHLTQVLLVGGILLGLVLVADGLEEHTQRLDRILRTLPQRSIDQVTETSLHHRSLQETDQVELADELDIAQHALAQLPLLFHPFFRVQCLILLGLLYDGVLLELLLATVQQQSRKADIVLLRHLLREHQAETRVHRAEARLCECHREHVCDHAAQNATRGGQLDQLHRETVKVLLREFVEQQQHLAKHQRLALLFGARRLARSLPALLADLQRLHRREVFLVLAPGAAHASTV
mmetsp:Transcript_29967/g.75413  ORF Transcript_29967/g.75413 Transcript_29967/m.75413 type:complete len:348 (+) Transcript_29967:1055-2098(+)